MSVESFLKRQHDKMLGRIERKVVIEGLDHITAYSVMGRTGVFLARLKGGEALETEFYDQLHQDLFSRLAQAGIEAEIYRLRGDMGNNREEDSRAFLRVTARRNHAEIEAARRDDILSRVVVISDTDSIRDKRGDS